MGENFWDNKYYCYDFLRNKRLKFWQEGEVIKPLQYSLCYLKFNVLFYFSIIQVILHMDPDLKLHSTSNTRIHRVSFPCFYFTNDAYENNQSDVIYHLDGKPIDNDEWVIYCSPKEMKDFLIATSVILIVGLTGVIVNLCKISHIF